MLRPLIGYWQWNEQDAVMQRPDGATVRLLGRDERRPSTGNRLWLRFAVEAPEGRLEVPVEQRLVGRDGNFRGLWYRADFRDLALGFALWSTAERLIADALSSWPAGHLAGGLPSGVGIEGGVHDGAFNERLFRLYLPEYGKTPVREGILSVPARERVWHYSPTNPAHPMPHLANLTPHGSAIMWDAIDAAARRGPTLSSDDSFIVVLPAEHGHVRLLYVAEDFQSDRFLCAPPYAKQEQIWHIREHGGEIPGPPKPEDPIPAFIKSLFRPPSQRRKDVDLPPVRRDLRQRIYASFHEALFAIPPYEVRTDRMKSKPTIVKSPAPWLRAGCYYLDCVTATALDNLELRCTFLDEPEPAMVLSSPAGPSFDPSTGIMTASDGSTLMLERAAPVPGIAPTELRFRCRHAGLDWPVIVHRDDRRPDRYSWSLSHEIQSRWNIDHGSCLVAWQAEGHAGLPDYARWDCLRQFIEEAILAWGDGPAAGPAPQSLATSGGWYDGEWRGSEFRRLMSRPIDTEMTCRDDTWRAYAPAPQWCSAGPAWQRTEAYDPARHYGGMPSPPPFEKRRADDPQVRLCSSGQARSWDGRDGYERRLDLTDYIGEGLHLRLAGNRERIGTTSVLGQGYEKPSADETGALPWPRNDAFEIAGLSLWRRLRDAAEGGLRDGESVTVTGCYLFDRCYAGTLRITALGVEPKDFDDHMFA